MLEPKPKPIPALLLSRTPGVKLKWELIGREDHQAASGPRCKNHRRTINNFSLIGSLLYFTYSDGKFLQRSIWNLQKHK